MYMLVISLRIVEEEEENLFAKKAGCQKRRWLPYVQ